MVTMSQLLQHTPPQLPQPLFAPSSQSVLGPSPYVSAVAPAGLPDSPISERLFDTAPAPATAADAAAPAALGTGLPSLQPQQAPIAAVVSSNMAVGPSHPSTTAFDSGAPPPYQSMSYHADTGVWFHGYWFVNYAHLMAYRRTAIAYNFHFFGIRPEFKPPSHLPRPRPPALRPPIQQQQLSLSSLAVGSVAVPSAAPPVAAPAPSSAAMGLDAVLRAWPSVSATAAYADVDAAAASNDSGGSERQAPELLSELVSPCCSPGSACSNADSEDIGSDGSRRDAAEAQDMLLLRDAQHAAAAAAEAAAAAAAAAADPAHAAALACALGSLTRDAAAAAAAAAGAAAATTPSGQCGGADGGSSGGFALALAMAEHGLEESPSKRVAREGGGFSWVGPIPVSWPVIPPSGGAAATTTTGQGAVPISSGSGSGGGSSTGNHLAPVGLPLSPLKCRVARPCGVVNSGGAAAWTGGLGFGGAQLGEPLSPIRVTGGGDQAAAACPAWLEPQVGDLVGRVIGEALWGSDDES